jgi:hypothetical protein
LPVKVEPELTRAGNSDLVLNISDDCIRIDSESIVFYREVLYRQGFSINRYKYDFTGNINAKH